MELQFLLCQIEISLISVNNHGFRFISICIRETEIYCAPLNPSPHIEYTPQSCSTGDSPYGTICQNTCSQIGFHLKDAITGETVAMDYHVCGDDGQWSSDFQIHDLECIGKFITAQAQFETHRSHSFVVRVLNLALISFSPVPPRINKDNTGFDGPD